jgi:hypothetical protein
MAIGVFMTMSGNFSLGSKIFISGIMDAYKVGMALSKGRALDLDEYLSGKALDYALIAVEVKFTEVSKAHAAKKAIEEGAKESIKQGGKEVIKQGAKESIVQLAKTAGLHMAKTVAVEKIAEWAASEVKENLLDGLEERVAGKVSRITESALEENAILLSPDCNIERQQILKEIQNAVFKATKTHKHARVINELASGVFKASSSLPSEFHSIGKVLYAGHKIGSMGDIISKIEPIIDDLKQAIDNIVNQAAARANVRLKGSFKSSADSEQKNICDSLSRNIGSMVGDAILNLIQRKVTNPMISWGVSYIIDESVENYQRKQQMLLANHKYQIKQAEELEQDLLKKINPKQKAPGGKTKPPTSTPKPFDYSLLLGQKTNQELVQLNKQSMEYLTYFFEASEKKTQKAEEVKVYDVSRSTDQSSTFSELFGIKTAQSSMFFSSLPRVSFIPTANAYTAGGGIALMEIELGIEGSLTAIYGVAKLAGRAIPIVGAAGLAYSYGQSVTNYITNAPKGSYRPVLANPLVTSGMLMYENFEDTLEFTGGDGGNNYISIPQSEQTTKLPAIDFKVIGRVDGQGHSGNLVNPYFDIDPNAGKPTILSTPIPYQPKSILFTPENSDNYLKWSQLPGFSPHMVKTWKESFPDQSQLPDNLDMSILYKKIDLDYGKLSKAFDSDVRYIHDKKYEGAKITDIDPSVVERMSGLIITDNSGKILGIHNTQDHHIIHQATEGAKQLFDELGLDIHGKENRITLPADEKLTEHGVTDMTQHVGRHDKDIVREIKEEVDAIKKSLDRGEVSKEGAREDLLKLIQKHRQGLETGKNPLNSVGRK